MFNRPRRCDRCDGTPRGRLKQVQAIAKESARYNIGFDRGMDTLMLPLAILRATSFRFARALG